MFGLKRGKAGKRDFCELTAQLFGVHINNIRLPLSGKAHILIAVDFILRTKVAFTPSHTNCAPSNPFIYSVQNKTGSTYCATRFVGADKGICSALAPLRQSFLAIRYKHRKAH